MSELFSASEILSLAKDIVGQAGPVEIDTSVYSHNINMDDSEKGEDIIILGKNENKITLDELVVLFTALDSLVDDLEDDTGRTYGYDGIEKESDNKYSIKWGS